MIGDPWAVSIMQATLAICDNVTVGKHYKGIIGWNGFEKLQKVASLMKGY